MTSERVADDDGPVTGEYTVVARRYRPRQFGQLVGQEAVARALTNAISTNRVAHAYLFTGARGVGKTSSARILAKALNCAKGPTPTPCDQCDACLGIAAGEDVDVLEIDGASNNGVDEVRAVRQNAATKPARSRYKIYIIDEVHMLSKAAFNALLKTLEEPPPHVKFIFATTEVQKIPDTILSRCQRFDFGTITATRIMEHLRTIVAGEGREADDAVLALLARRGNGSMRDAESLLDQLLAFGGERLTMDEVHALLGTAAEERVLGLAGAVLAGEVAQALAMLSACVDEGLQLGELLDQLVDYWRDLMLARAASQPAAVLNVMATHRDTLIQQARQLSLDTILAGLDILTTTKARFRGTLHSRVLLEMALVRLARLDELLPVTQLVQYARQPGSMPVSPPTARSSSTTAGTPRPVEPPEGVKKKADDLPAAAGSTALTAENVAAVWPRVLTAMTKFLASEVRKCGLPAITGPKTLALRFPTEYNHEYDYCTAHQSKIAEAVEQVTGHPWVLRLEKVHSPVGQGVREPAGVGALGMTGGVGGQHGMSRGGKPGNGMAVAGGGVSQPTSRNRRRDEILAEPLLARAVELLGASLLSLDDGFGSEPAKPHAPDSGGAGGEPGTSDEAG